MEIIELTALASKFNVESRLGSNPPKDESKNPDKPPTYTYRELATATNNFREESFIGEGGFGLVYKGKLERTGQVNHLMHEKLIFLDFILLQWWPYSFLSFLFLFYFWLAFSQEFSWFIYLFNIEKSIIVSRLWLLRNLTIQVSKGTRNFWWKFSCLLFCVTLTLSHCLVTVLKGISVFLYMNICP